MSNTAAPLNLTVLETDLRAAVDGDVWFDETHRQLYSTDASVYQITPRCVVLPRHGEDVLAAADVARRHGVAILPRGAGTSLAGQTVCDAIVIDTSKYMNKVLEVNADEGWARVQPGVVRDNLNEVVRPHNLHFAPDPATTSRATVGGMIGNNSAGSRSIRYGMTIRHVIELDVLLSDGTRMTLAPTSKADWERRAATPTREGEIYRHFKSLIDTHADEIDARFPKVMRRCTGYNLDEFTDEKASWNLCDVFTGSEGTLGLTLEARIKLTPLPQHACMCVLHYDNLLDAVRSVHPIVQMGPSAVEILDNTVVSNAMTNLSVAPLCDFIEGTPDSILIVEFAGDSREVVREQTTKMIETIKALGYGYAYVIRDDTNGMARIWQVRKNGLGLMLGMKGDRKPLAFIEDAAVPTEDLSEYIEEVLALCREEQTECAMYAHASVGLIHVRPILDLRRADDIQRFVNIANKTFELVQHYKGSWSGEHGDGRVRSAFHQRYFGPTLCQAFADVKALFDPAGLMNPGSIVNPPPIDKDLRYGTAYKTPDFVTEFQFAEGSFAAAVEMCTGVGACRQTLVGTMCPSYRATGNEEDSVRGRANILRLAMTGQLADGDEEATDTAVREVLDLCLSCKACKSECPSNIDMARLKSEHLNRHHQRAGLNFRDRLIDKTATAAACCSGAWAPVVNAIQRSTPFRLLLEKTAGFDRRRALPAYTSQRLDRWFKARKSAAPQTPTVALFADTYANCYESEVGRAAVDLLEGAGYHVALIQPGCCQRPRVSHGLLGAARRDGEKTLRGIDQWIQKGLCVVVLEPSCCSALTDDLPDLINDDALKQRIRTHVMTIDAFLARELDEGRINATFTSTLNAVQLHGHCHQKALYGIEGMQRVYKEVEGLEVEVIQSGCCGMAGSFGYEKEHYDLSQRIAEDRLLPAIRDAAPGTTVVANGFSCRHQIADFGHVKALHWVQTLNANIQRPTPKSQ